MQSQMANLTTITLLLSCTETVSDHTEDERPLNLAEINAWFYENGHRYGLTNVSPAAQVIDFLLVGEFKGFNADAFTEFFNGLEWRDEQNVCLIIQTADGYWERVK